MHPTNVNASIKVAIAALGSEGRKFYKWKIVDYPKCHLV